MFFRPVKTGPLTMTLGRDPFQTFRRAVAAYHRASRRRDAAPVQGGGDLPTRLRARRPGPRGSPASRGGVRLGVALRRPGRWRGRRRAEGCRGPVPGLGGGERGLRALRDHRALLLGQGGVEVQEERLDVGAKIGTRNGVLCAIRPRNEVHVAREPVELGDGDRARLPVAAGPGQRGGELRAAVERVGALACSRPR